ncbi:hypothetical protein CPAR01_09038 [Colletotrichum paranaense]|uniref:Uncharacterized protein n=5 Tax=Colletotrichum acutatum species complex TaxID=2707335 RepID=A0A9Q8WCQ7_9PEZI|nr:uncharacterized protein CLUP02_03327 [Colletotrichum lupini]XP_060319165.1 uncharacterized protein CCOS01_02324 [Colletotrichum costaricense]XP_060347434.1 uncharacterized protein CPAR01_09038 [Colletotrichum paranaense]XP_060387497.1 uncharacterized protein CTAM01_01923 [Colletotrichum tamarilloi]KAI3541811.1 hypothetical protein CSPX01_07319 [Colletotrichum filicis]KAK1466720.1 hypothetical protein CMEL01_10713 [Colletotrichum melonis]KAK1509800.1 hypothetical protein CTAM01_01923 [Colle
MSGRVRVPLLRQISTGRLFSSPPPAHPSSLPVPVLS